jgi:hypothetical protein
MLSPYARWMYNWETRLTAVDNNRVVRPLDWGIEWTREWPCRNGFLPTQTPEERERYLREYNLRAVASSDEFFSYRTPSDFRLELREVQVFSTREIPDPKLEKKVHGTYGEFLRFTSPVSTPYPENNLANARWFPAKGKSAIVLLPQWNSDALSHNGLAGILNRLGISVLRLSMPYHDIRRPAEIRRADYAVSANIGRTLDAARQGVLDVRCCLDWLQSQGYERLNLLRGRRLVRSINATYPSGPRTAYRSGTTARAVDGHQPNLVLQTLRPLPAKIADRLCAIRSDVLAGIFPASCRRIQAPPTRPQSYGASLWPLLDRRSPLQIP